MEFIPLEAQSKKVKKGGKKERPGKGKKDTETLSSKTNAEIIKARKRKLQSKMMEKKKVKNKYREMVAKKGSKRIALKKKNDEGESGDDEDEEEEESSKKSPETSEMDEEKSDNNEGEEEDDEEDEDEDEESLIEKKQENAIMEKWKKMDEKMKNRLFVKMKEKILSEAQVKELHPDIRRVILPRKKKPRWCWVVFVSQEKALAAFQDLCKNPKVFVSKPNPRQGVEKKREEKLKTIKRKKENRKKLQQMWS